MIVLNFPDYSRDVALLRLYKVLDNVDLISEDILFLTEQNIGVSRHNSV